jgi:ATP-dependent RNA helicase A
VRIQGYRYVGFGNSTNKKDAEKNAARDFINFLVREGKVREQDLPESEQSGATLASQSDFQQPPQQSYGNPSNMMNTPVGARGNLSAFSPDQLGQAYRPAQYDNSNSELGGFNSMMERAREQARMEEAESLDVNAAIHGNWTVENAKTKLNMFMQSHKISGEYKYTSVGPDHNKYI